MCTKFLWTRISHSVWTNQPDRPTNQRTKSNGRQRESQTKWKWKNFLLFSLIEPVVCVWTVNQSIWLDTRHAVTGRRREQRIIYALQCFDVRSKRKQISLSSARWWQPLHLHGCLCAAKSYNFVAHVSHVNEQNVAETFNFSDLPYGMTLFQNSTLPTSSVHSISHALSASEPLWL